MSGSAGGLAVLIESGPEVSLAELERHWSSAQTFAYVHDKSAAAVAWPKGTPEQLPPAYREDHFCLLTSGSTGAPKLVIGRKDSSEALARVLHHAQDSGSVRETIVSLPLTYCYAFVNQWLWSRVMRRKLVLTPGFAKPELFRDALRRAEDAMLCLVGPQAALLRNLFGGERFPGVIRLHFAGGRFPQEQLPALREMFPNAAVFNNYGCAEALPRLTLRRAEDGESASDIGRPLPGVQLKSGENGELLFLSQYRSVGQLDATGFRSIAPGEWIPNGDLVRSGSNGHWHLLGRAGEVFKRYGEKIALPQVLSTVNRQWQGQVGYYREKDGAGEDGYVLVLSPQPTEDHLRGLMQVFRSSHPRTHWPLRIECAPVLPLHPNGKVDSLACQSMENRSLLWRQRI
jgi:acyl-CoA synthetase (AMP-forming)/AMP-acid ligase II